ncbi:MAG: protein-glutamate O-methyltransferase CheR [Deltaproteobacteria bacterium]|nr:protein-glutamate O-methyltransferase CheR [Deltaproteobacteria bacterium]
MLTLGIDTRPKLSNEAFGLLRDIIYAKSGMFFPESKKYLLEKRLVKRLEEKNLKTFEDYYYFLTYDPEKNKELYKLINCVVTNETSFFRDVMQLDSFTKGVIPKLVREKTNAGKRNLKLWSAACSTGEEPFTLGMMLLEELNGRGFSVEILGSDISDHVLKSAEAATYEKYTLRNTPEQYLRRYFNNNGDSYTVAKKVQDLVKYRKINLIDSVETRAVRDIDVIFCRNVLIYFDDSSRRKAVNHLYDSLAKGGYLFLGFSETLHTVTRLFRPVSFERTVVYQKV